MWTAGSSSFVPCVKALSVVPLGVSTRQPLEVAQFMLDANVDQSSLPDVLTTRLPSFPSNVLGVRFAPDAATKNTANAPPATSVAASNSPRRPRRRNSLTFRLTALTSPVGVANLLLVMSVGRPAVPGPDPEG